MKWIGRLHRGHTLRTIIKAMKSSLSRNGASSTTSQYPLYQQQQQQYYHQQISKSKRSKSMDDFGAQMVFEQTSRVQRNNARNGSGYHPSSSSSSAQMGKRSPPNNALVRTTNHHPPQPQHKNQMRYSVDNLLEIDTSYYNNYQVRSDLITSFTRPIYSWAIKQNRAPIMGSKQWAKWWMGLNQHRVLRSSVYSAWRNVDFNFSRSAAWMSDERMKNSVRWRNQRKVALPEKHRIASRSSENLFKHLSLIHK